MSTGLGQLRSIAESKAEAESKMARKLLGRNSEEHQKRIGSAEVADMYSGQQQTSAEGSSAGLYNSSIASGFKSKNRMKIA